MKLIIINEAKSSSELKNHCEHWSSEAIDLAAEEGGPLNQGDIIETLLDPPSGEKLDPADHKFVKDWVKSNWSKLTKEYREAKADWKEDQEKWESKKMNEGRKSKAAHKFEDNYGKPMYKTCKECGLPMAECTCESTKIKAKKGKVVEKKLKEAIRLLVREMLNEKRLTESKSKHTYGGFKIGDEVACLNRAHTKDLYLGKVSNLQRDGNIEVSIPHEGPIVFEPKDLRKEYSESNKYKQRGYAGVKESSTSQIEPLIGKEAAIKYRKASGEVKTYFGRFTKLKGELVMMGVLGKGLRTFKIANILDVRPVASEQLSMKQRSELDEMCKEGGPGSGQYKRAAKEFGQDPAKFIKKADQMAKKWKQSPETAAERLSKKGYAGVKDEMCGSQKKNELIAIKEESEWGRRMEIQIYGDGYKNGYADAKNGKPAQKNESAEQKGLISEANKFSDKWYLKNDLMNAEEELRGLQNTSNAHKNSPQHDARIARAKARVVQCQKALKSAGKDSGEREKQGYGKSDKIMPEGGPGSGRQGDSKKEKPRWYGTEDDPHGYNRSPEQIAADSQKVADKVKAKRDRDQKSGKTAKKAWGKYFAGKQSMAGRYHADVEETA